MKIIYTDKNRKDINYLPPCQIDLAFGTDENNFQIDVDIANHCMKDGQFFYIEDTEYGGMVDEIKSNTLTKKVSYIGRTWHGILNSKVLCPDAGEDYLIVSGDLGTIIDSLIDRCDLNELFDVNIEEEIEVNDFQFFRYEYLYDGLKRLISAYDFGLGLLYNQTTKKVSLYLRPIANYSNYEEWNSEQFKIIIDQNKKPVNHLVCLGTGDLKDRAVIHLYTDENGNVQPYAITDTPVEDADYILDNRNQVLFGKEDKQEVYDYTGAQTAEIYIMLDEKPSNWEERYIDYYQQDSNDNYNLLERTYEKKYSMLTSDNAPDDWSTNITSYYKKEGNVYKRLTEQGEKTVSYPIANNNKKPKGWDDDKNWKTGKSTKWYYQYSDGQTASWELIPAASYPKYKKLKMRPTDWDKNKENYYVKFEIFMYKYEEQKKVSGKWVKSTRWSYEQFKTIDTSTYKLKLVDIQITDEGKKIKISDYVKTKYADISEFKDYDKAIKKFRFIYEKVTKYKHPSFTHYKENGGVHLKKEAYQAITYVKNYYYELSEIKEKVPNFVEKQYYRKAFDRYADLIANAIEKLKEYWQQNKIEVSLDADMEYYIGDIVGANEKITGTTVVASVTKKILKINEKGKVSINYEVGGNE